MEKEIEISKELEAKIEIKDGKLAVVADYVGKIGGAEVKIFVTTDAVIDLICAKIPGQIDDKLGELLKAALKKV